MSPDFNSHTFDDLPFPPLLTTSQWRHVQQSRSLTHRELQIASLLARGACNRQLGHLLKICGPTVREHCRSLYQKMQCRRLGNQKRLELVLTVVHLFFSELGQVAADPSLETIDVPGAFRR